MKWIIPVLLVACDGDSKTTDTSADTVVDVPFELTSDAFAEGETIPTVHECGPPLSATGPGDNVSPSLTWTAGPEGTASYAVVVRDRDAKIAQFPEGIIHWVVYNIPADALALPEGVADGADVAAVSGALQAEIQGSGYYGYFGPCSPNSVNTYEFTVHAMGDAEIDTDGDASESNVAAIVEASALESASLSGES